MEEFERREEAATGKGSNATGKGSKRASPSKVRVRSNVDGFVPRTHDDNL